MTEELETVFPETVESEVAELEQVLPDLALPESGQPQMDPDGLKTLEEVGAVYDVPIRVQAVLGRAYTDLGALMQMKPGDVLDLDRRVGSPVDILVNDRMIARGEVVLIDGVLGVTLTEVVREGS